MNYKSVLVYTGYAENSIQRLETFEATSLLEAVQLVEQNQLNNMLADNEHLDEDFYKEFFGDGRITHGVGIVESGEENVTLVLGEFNEWFDKVSSYDDWSDELNDKWCTFINEQSF